jgi:transcriptional regulator with XRE-family HTH domain
MSTAKATPEGGDLRQLRRAAGLSQQELAERTHCSIAIVRLLESGYQPKHSDVLPRLVAVLESDTAPMGEPDAVVEARQGRRHRAA